MGQLSTHALLLLLAAAVVAAACCWSPAAADNAAVDFICQSTPFPGLCAKTAGKHAKTYAAVDALTVLKMQVDAFVMRVNAARAHINKLRRSAPMTPRVTEVLKLCDSLYTDALDNMGACRRAIGFKDGDTIRATMSMAAQDMQFCDEEFKKAGAPNTLKHFDNSLIHMTEICRTLSNMITK